MKTNVLILVQNPNENAKEFGERITEAIANKELMLPHPIQFTTTSDGRQTCNIIHLTKEESNSPSDKKLVGTPTSAS